MDNRFSQYTPKLVSCLREGYTRRLFFGDLTGGMTTAIIALPLAMALGIASIPQSVAVQMQQIHPWLTPPAVGMFTTIIAGIIISALGGSRVQIGGPTAAFIPIVFAIAETYGYSGLLAATAMAGVIVLLMGFFKFGQFIKYIPYPVTTGFTAGIAVTILVSQIKDFLGLRLVDAQGEAINLPAAFLPKVHLLATSLASTHWAAATVGAGSLVALILLRRFKPRWPGAIIVITLSAVIVTVMGWSAGDTPLVETIGSRFGGIPERLPSPQFPAMSFGLLVDLVPSAATIAILCAIESLLSAVVADGMTGYRHRSNQELVAQGLANIGSALFSGLPATGAIARTAANIKGGGATPLAGIFHSLIILGFMLLLAPLAKAVPLSALSAVLILVAVNISEVGRFRSLLRAPKSDVLTLLATFGLTVFVDITVGVGIGLVLAGFLFMRRMAETSTIQTVRESTQTDQEPIYADAKDPVPLTEEHIPHGVEVYEINGPFFFGVAYRLGDILRQLAAPPKVFILRMRYVPHIDATAMNALEEFAKSCRRKHITLLLAGVHMLPAVEMKKCGLLEKIGMESVFESIDDALARAKQLLNEDADATDTSPAAS